MTSITLFGDHSVASGKILIVVEGAIEEASVANRATNTFERRRGDVSIDAPQEGDLAADEYTDNDSFPR